MCWYSQQERLSTRKAIEGEELIVREFPAQGRWLASPADPETPVCLPNGCMLRLSDIPKGLQRELKVGTEAVVEFREIYQRTADSWLARIFLPPRLCFDVAILPNGRSIEISALDTRVKVDVLSPAVVAPVWEAAEEIHDPPGVDRGNSIIFR